GAARGDVDELDVVTRLDARAADPVLIDRAAADAASPVDAFDYSGFHVRLYRSNLRILVLPVSPKTRTTNCASPGPRTYKLPEVAVPCGVKTTMSPAPSFTGSPSGASPDASTAGRSRITPKSTPGN